MCRIFIYLVSSIILLSTASNVCADLVGYWRFEIDLDAGYQMLDT